MTLDDMTLAEAEKARDRMEAAQDEVERARAEYHRAVRRLHAAGGTLREIADALGLSHQRVHQVVDSGSMIDPEAPAKKSSGLINCTFCNTSQKETKKLIAGPGVYICEVCIAGAVALGDGNEPPDLRRAPRYGPRHVGARPIRVLRKEANEGRLVRGRSAQRRAHLQ